MATPATAQAYDRSSAHGSPVSVAGIRHDLAISRERMARLLDVSSRIIARWEEQNQLPSSRWVRYVLIRIGDIVEGASESLTDNGLKAIMSTPQPVFGDRSGLEMIERGELVTVYRELAGMDEGYSGR